MLLWLTCRIPGRLSVGNQIQVGLFHHLSCPPTAAAIVPQTAMRYIFCRYPAFVDALRDLDDPLTMTHLFATLPAESNHDIPAKVVANARRLSMEFQAYVVRAHALRKVFVSVKGFYYQADIQGQAVTWLVPHNLAQASFCHTYKTISAFCSLASCWYDNFAVQLGSRCVCTALVCMYLTQHAFQALLLLVHFISCAKTLGVDYVISSIFFCCVKMSMQPLSDCPLEFPLTVWTRRTSAFEMQVLPADVDYRVMLTFLEFYQTLLQFVNYKLYHSLSVHYPPVLDSKLEEAAAGLASIMQDIAQHQPHKPSTQPAQLPNQQIDSQSDTAMVDVQERLQEAAAAAAASDGEDDEEVGEIDSGDDDDASSSADEEASATAPGGDSVTGKHSGLAVVKLLLQLLAFKWAANSDQHPHVGILNTP